MNPALKVLFDHMSEVTKGMPLEVFDIQAVHEAVKTNRALDVRRAPIRMPFNPCILSLPRLSDEHESPTAFFCSITSKELSVYAFSSRCNSTGRSGLLGRAYVRVDDDMRIVSSDATIDMWSDAISHGVKTAGLPVDEVRASLAWVIGSGMRALVSMCAFLNCKNVSSVVTEQSAAVRHIQRLRNLRGLPSIPPFREHTLVLHPCGKSAHGEGVATGDMLAMHMQRGHFKTYTTEKPLLGKVTGTFWWSPHVRGNADVGIVAKTYKVEVD